MFFCPKENSTLHQVNKAVNKTKTSCVTDTAEANINLWGVGTKSVEKNKGVWQCLLTEYRILTDWSMSIQTLVQRVTFIIREGLEKKMKLAHKSFCWLATRFKVILGLVYFCCKVRRSSSVRMVEQHDSLVSLSDFVSGGRCTGTCAHRDKVKGL